MLRRRREDDIQVAVVDQHCVARTVEVDGDAKDRIVRRTICPHRVCDIHRAQHIRALPLGACRAPCVRTRIPSAQANCPVDAGRAATLPARPVPCGTDRRRRARGNRCRVSRSGSAGPSPRPSSSPPAQPAWKATAPHTAPDRRASARMPHRCTCRRRRASRQSWCRPGGARHR